MSGHFKLMEAAVAIVVALTFAGCGGSTPAPSSTPPVTPSRAAESPSPSPTPSPAAAVQRAEKSLPAAIEESAAAATGGDLYVMGGFDAVGNSLRTVYVFNGTSWGTGPRLPIGLDHASAATLDGHVYLAGGHSFGRDSARVFRLDGASWIEVAAMHHARGGHALVAAAGRLYVIGGNTASSQVPATEVYDPASNRWTDLLALPLPRNHVAGFTFQGKVCVAGGRSPNTTRVDCFDPSARTWTRLANLPGPTSGAGAATLESGEVVLMGGQDAVESRMVTQLVHLGLDRRWSSVLKMLVPRHGFELAVFHGRAWACGGGLAPGLHPVATCTSVV
jgi:N-acetylneuraminic acid mutarotase